MHRVQVLEVKSFGLCTGALRVWVNGGKSFGFPSGLGVTSSGDKVLVGITVWTVPLLPFGRTHHMSHVQHSWHGANSLFVHMACCKCCLQPVRKPLASIHSSSHACALALLCHWHVVLLQGLFGASACLGTVGLRDFERKVSKP